MALGIGETLRATRRQQRLTLSQAAAEIRVREPYLAALEDEKFSKLGGDVYVRAFLRGYSEYLGLDPDQIVEQYRRQYERAERPPAGPTFNRPERPGPPGQERADRPAQAPALPPPPPPPPPPAPRFDRQGAPQSFEQRPEREAAAAFSWGHQALPGYEGTERQAPPSFDRPERPTPPPPSFDRTERRTPPPPSPVDRTQRQAPPPLDRTELHETSAFERSALTEPPPGPPPRRGGFEDDEDDDDLLDDDRSPSRRAIILFGVLLVLLVLAFIAFRGRGSAPETELTDAPAAVETPPADSPPAGAESPDGEAPDAPAETAPEAPPQEPLTEVNVEVIVGEGPSWLRATVDEEVEVVGTQEPGSTFAFAGDESVVLRIGDASQVQVLLNGEDQGELGGPTEVVDLEYRIGEVP